MMQPKQPTFRLDDVVSLVEVEVYIKSLDYFGREHGRSRVWVQRDEADEFLKNPIAWWAAHHQCSEQEVRRWLYDKTTDAFDGGDGRYLRCIALTRRGKRCRMPLRGGHSPTFRQWLEHERTGGAYCAVHEEGS